MYQSMDRWVSEQMNGHIARSSMMRCVCLWLVLAAGVAWPASAQSDVARVGQLHWPKGEKIGVWIDPVNAPPGGNGLVERALKTWTEAAQGRFTLHRAASSAAAAVRVRFVRSSGLYGEAAPRLDPAIGAIRRVDVTIASEIAGDRLDKALVLYLTTLHEMGHALGLPHSDDFSTIMYGFRRPDDGERYFAAYRSRLRSIDDIGSAQATGLSPEDVAALRALYDK